MDLHELLDTNYGPNGDVLLRQELISGIDPGACLKGETLLHVAVRRRRLNAVVILLEYGADINALNAHGKTAFAHALRRGFDEVAGFLQEKGAKTALNAADQFAVAVVNGRYDEARAIIKQHPGCVHTGNPEEDRLLADVAGRNRIEAVTLLLAAGADLTARGLDDGTPLHQAAWFGQPVNARLLLDAGAPLDIFDKIHTSSPIGWAVHGARYSGGADIRRGVYVELVRMLLDAGSSLHYPDAPDGDAYLRRLKNDAIPAIRAILPVTGN
ncbi:MAG: ankyrin repeat domain-containing protein [Saprospiraceae bacterium]|nr:ankyrin repeat domain-containing protein [Lewinella sp.]